MYCKNCGCKIEIGETFCKNCGSKTEYSDKSKLGTISITRAKKYVGCLIDFDVYLDDSRIGTLKNGATLTYEVPLGEHEITIKTMTETPTTQKITLTENKRNVKLTVKLKMGLVMGKPSIENIEYF